MEKIIGLSGLFIKPNDPKALSTWYNTHFGACVGNTSLALKNGDLTVTDEPAVTVFSFFKSSTDYFSPSVKDCMINLRVQNGDTMLQQ